MWLKISPLAHNCSKSRLTFHPFQCAFPIPFSVFSRPFPGPPEDVLMYAEHTLANSPRIAATSYQLSLFNQNQTRPFLKIKVVGNKFLFLRWHRLRNCGFSLTAFLFSRKGLSGLGLIVIIRMLLM